MQESATGRHRDRDRDSKHHVTEWNEKQNSALKFVTPELGGKKSFHHKFFTSATKHFTAPSSQMALVKAFNK